MEYVLKVKEDKGKFICLSKHQSIFLFGRKQSADRVVSKGILVTVYQNKEIKMKKIILIFLFVTANGAVAVGQSNNEYDFGYRHKQSMSGGIRMASPGYVPPNYEAIVQNSFNKGIESVNNQYYTPSFGMLKYDTAQFSTSSEQTDNRTKKDLCPLYGCNEITASYQPRSWSDLIFGKITLKLKK